MNVITWVRYYRNQIELSPPHAYSYGYGITKWNTRYCALGDQVVRDVVIKQWNGVVDFTFKEKRDGQLVSAQKVKHKLTDNIDQIYECQFDPVTGERHLRHQMTADGFYRGKKVVEIKQKEEEIEE